MLLLLVCRHRLPPLLLPWLVCSGNAAPGSDWSCTAGAAAVHRVMVLQCCQHGAYASVHNQPGTESSGPSQPGTLWFPQPRIIHHIESDPVLSCETANNKRV